MRKQGGIVESHFACTCYRLSDNLWGKEPRDCNRLKVAPKGIQNVHIHVTVRWWQYYQFHVGCEQSHWFIIFIYHTLVSFSQKFLRKFQQWYVVRMFVKFWSFSGSTFFIYKNGFLNIHSNDVRQVLVETHDEFPTLVVQSEIVMWPRRYQDMSRYLAT